MVSSPTVESEVFDAPTRHAGLTNANLCDSVSEQLAVPVLARFTEHISKQLSHVDSGLGARDPKRNVSDMSGSRMLRRCPSLAMSFR